MFRVVVAPSTHQPSSRSVSDRLNENKWPCFVTNWQYNYTPAWWHRWRPDSSLLRLRYVLQYLTNNDVGGISNWWYPSRHLAIALSSNIAVTSRPYVLYCRQSKYVNSTVSTYYAAMPCWMLNQRLERDGIFFYPFLLRILKDHKTPVFSMCQTFVKYRNWVRKKLLSSWLFT